MTYQETLDWMFGQLPMYQRDGQSAYKVDLTNTRKLIEHLHHPEKLFKSIHIAGTNGKGSTSHMLASVLAESGYKTGLYTSPHLKDFRERIKINGEMISPKKVTGFIEKNIDFFKREQLSFFEMTVGLAFSYFAEEAVDIAIIETGLGGRLDSTNIITPELSIITNIGLDHTKFLGDTLPEIAFEKAGIIKSGIPVVIGEKQIECQAVFEKKAKESNATLYWADDSSFSDYTSDLKGIYQEKNKRTVLQGLTVLKDKGWNIPEIAIQKGLSKVIANTGLQGRWQVLSEEPKIVCDTGHNREGLTQVMLQLQKEHYDKLHIVIGVVNDKDLTSILPLFPKEATYYFCKPSVPRGLSAEKLQREAKKYNLLGHTYASVKKALKSAKEEVTKDDFIYIGGSTFTVAEII